MNTEMKHALRLALGIISGRITELSADEYGLLGYNIHHPSAFHGKPDWNQVRELAEDVVYDIIVAVTGAEHGRF